MKKQTRKTYRLQSVPPYLILVFKRFTKTLLVVEKNNTVVKFSARKLDIRRRSAFVLLLCH